VRLHDVERERETESRSGDAFRFRRLNAMEFFEDPRLLLAGNSDAMIDDIDEGFASSASHAHLDLSRPAGVFHGVAEKVEDRLLQRVGICE
jgi:hypothetical protein